MVRFRFRRSLVLRALLITEAAGNEKRASRVEARAEAICCRPFRRFAPGPVGYATRLIGSVGGVPTFISKSSDSTLRARCAAGRYIILISADYRVRFDLGDLREANVYKRASALRARQTRPWQGTFPHCLAGGWLAPFGGALQLRENRVGAQASARAARARRPRCRGRLRRA